MAGLGGQHAIHSQLMAPEQDSLLLNSSRLFWLFDAMLPVLVEEKPFVPVVVSLPQLAPKVSSFS